VLCVNEKATSGAGAYAVTMLPMGLGYFEGVTHDYQRRDTLYATLGIANGDVIAQCKSMEFVPSLVFPSKGCEVARYTEFPASEFYVEQEKTLGGVAHKFDGLQNLVRVLFLFDLLVHVPLV